MSRDNSKNNQLRQSYDSTISSKKDTNASKPKHHKRNVIHEIEPAYFTESSNPLEYEN